MRQTSFVALDLVSILIPKRINYHPNAKLLDKKKININDLNTAVRSIKNITLIKHTDMKTYQRATHNNIASENIDNYITCLQNTIQYRELSGMHVKLPSCHINNRSGAHSNLATNFASELLK